MTPRRALSGMFSGPHAGAALCAVALCLCLCAGTASAGSYTHLACGGADVADAGSGWFAMQLQAPVGTTQAVNGCGTGGGLGAELTPTDDAAVNPGVGVGWRYVPPVNTRIQSAALTVRGWGTVFWQMSTQFVLAADAEVRFQLDGVAGSAGWPAQTASTGPINAGSLQALLRCAPSSLPCKTQYNLGWMDIRNLGVVLTDDNAPLVTGPVTGSLASSQVVDGSVSVAFPVTDAGGGLREVQLFSDGVRVARAAVADGACTPIAGVDGAWVFAAARPCPTAASVAPSFDTRLVADGPHTLAVKVVDAAGNVTTVYTAAKIVANAPPVNTAAPQFARADLAAAPLIAEPLRVDAGTWTGPNLTFSYEWQRCAADGEPCIPIADASAPSYNPIRADEGKRLRVAVTARNAVAVTRFSPQTGVVRSAPLQAGTSEFGRGGVNGTPEGGDACPGDDARLTAPALRDGVVRLGFRSRVRVRVRLTCAADGRPIGNAALRTTTQTAGDPDPGTGLVRTDGDGRAELSFDGRASRTVVLTYRLYASDDVSRATLTIRAFVRGRMTLTARQRGASAVFRGRVLGGQVPARGVSVQLQWRDGQQWRPVAMLKTDRTGRYRYTYRFSSRARGFRYAFRTVVTPGQTDYPFLPATSPVRHAGR